MATGLPSRSYKCSECDRTWDARGSDLHDRPKPGWKFCPFDGTELDVRDYVIPLKTQVITISGEKLRRKSKA